MASRVLPEIGWSRSAVEYFLKQISLMDTNNFPNKLGVGEREARIYSELVYERNFGLGHGIGRSGEIDAEQPKAVGSSLLYKLCKYLVKDSLKISGYQKINSLIIVPLATGMSLTLAFSALKNKKKAA